MIPKLAFWILTIDLRYKNMRRILVIGAKGMLGRDLVGVLSGHPDREVVGWDIDEIDIREEQETIARIASSRAEIVVNLAAYTDVDGCEQDEEKAFAINAEGMKHVALGALKCGAKVIYLSTDYVFDGKQGRPYLENDPSNPINVYGRSKLRGEQYAQDLVKDALIVRTQWLYGRHGKNFIASILRLAREKGTLSIVNDQVGSPTYTVDLSKAIAALIEHGARGIYHVANSDFCSWYALGLEVLKLSGMTRVGVTPISTKESGRSAARPAYSVLNTEKLKRDTGWVMRPWLEALEEYLSKRS